MALHVYLISAKSFIGSTTNDVAHMNSVPFLMMNFKVLISENVIQCRPPTSSHSRALDSHSTRARLARDSIECNNDSRALTQSKTAGTKTYTIN